MYYVALHLAFPASSNPSKSEKVGWGCGSGQSTIGSGEGIFKSKWGGEGGGGKEAVRATTSSDVGVDGRGALSTWPISSHSTLLEEEEGRLLLPLKDRTQHLGKK